MTRIPLAETKRTRRPARESAAMDAAVERAVRSGVLR